MNVKLTSNMIGDWLKSITVFDLIKMALKVAPVVGVIWAWGIPYLSTQAAELLTQELKKQGLDPEKFRDVPKQIEDLNETVKQIQENQKQLIDLLTPPAPKKAEQQ